MLKYQSDTVWLFDYDLTLYGQNERHVLDSLDRKITQFVQKIGNPSMSWEEANYLRRDFCTRYGTTLAGLRAKFGTCPQEFFDFIHTPEGLLYPAPNSALQDLLLKLPGRRYIFTNGRRDWVEPGLIAMGLQNLFLDIFDIAFFGWDNKPNAGPYAQVESHLGEKPGQIVFFDDCPENLLPAKARGWTTVYIGPKIAQGKEELYCDLHLETILQLALYLRPVQ